MTTSQIIKYIYKEYNLSNDKSSLSFQKNMLAKKYKEKLMLKVDHLLTPSLKEVLYNIKHKLNSVPLCKVCHNKCVKFNVSKNSYKPYCSIQCVHNDKLQKKKNSIKALNTMKNDLDDNGVSVSKKRCLKGAETLRNTIDSEGLNGLKKRGIKSKRTHLSNLDDNGLNGYQRLGINSSKLQNSDEFKIKHNQLLSTDIPLFKLYTNKVRNLSNTMYKRHLNIINPDNKKRSKYDYHLDHILSISEGFKNNIPIYIVASVFNLEMKTAKDNLTKWKSSEMTPEDLVNKFYTKC